MHRLLKRQIRRIFGKEKSVDDFPEDIQELLNIISSSYHNYDDEREFIEHTLNLHVQDLNSEKTRAETANRAKSEFLANMSHELRTPLHAILSFAEIAMDRIDSASQEKQLRYLETIKLSGDRLLYLVNDLLDISKLEAGVSEFSFSENDILLTINAACSEFNSSIRDKQITLSHEILTAGTLAYYDAYKIIQVISNLLSNAIRYSPVNSKIILRLEDSVLYSSHTGSDISNPAALKLSIIDQGIGIPEQELTSIFEKFVQSSLTRTNAGGTGLGLSICKQIIENHGGEIIAENNPQGGSAFSFTLPVKPY